MLLASHKSNDPKVISAAELQRQVDDLFANYNKLAISLDIPIVSEDKVDPKIVFKDAGVKNEQKVSGDDDNTVIKEIGQHTREKRNIKVRNIYMIFVCVFFLDLSQLFN